jgi:hypothetical protein
VAADDDIWRSLTLRTFPVPVRPEPPTPGGWRGLYKCVRARVHSCVLLATPRPFRLGFGAYEQRALALARFNHSLVYGVLLSKDLQTTLDAFYPRLWR